MVAHLARWGLAVMALYFVWRGTRQEWESYALGYYVAAIVVALLYVGSQ